MAVAFNAGESVMALAWDTDNSRIAGVDEWGTIYLWDATTSEREMTLLSDNQVAARQKIAWDDEYGIAVSTTDQIVGWNPDTGEQTFAIASPSVNGLEWLPNGDLIYTSGTLTTVQTVSPFDSEAITYAIAWSPDGSMIAVGGGLELCEPDDPASSFLVILDASTQQILHNLYGGPCHINSIDWSPDGSQLAASNGGSDRGLRVWDAETGTLVSQVQRGGQGTITVRWSPNGEYLAATGIDNTTGILSPVTGEVLDGPPTGGAGVDWSPDSTKIVTASFYEERIYVGDVLTQERLLTIEDQPNGGDVEWSPDGTRFATSYINGDIYIWDASTGDNLKIISPGILRGWRVHWSPDSQYVAMTYRDNTLRVWDASTGNLHSTVENVSARSLDFAWSPDGTRLAYGGENGAVNIITVFENESVSPAERNISPRIIFASDRGDVNAQVYSMNPDGTNVQIFGEDRTYITPACSSNGEYLAVVSDAIYVMRADGSDLKRIEVERFDPYSGLSVSNDGSKIAFLSLRDMNSEIYLVNADGTDETRFTNTVAGEASPAISPDGTKILFVSFVDNIGSLYVADIAGANQTLLMQGVSDASWSPDGMQIVFTSSQNGMLDIARINADGTNLVQLISHPSADYGPRWSPDGNRIAFVSKRDGNMEIYTMDSDGQNIQRVTNDPEFDDQPCWLNIPAE